MAYTLSFDASQKVKKGEVKGLANHIFRDALETDLEHSNSDIDSNMTQNNLSYFYNQTKNKFEVCTDVGQVEESLQARLSCVKKPLRKDAVVIRGIILQLDPEYYTEHDSEQEKIQSYNAMLNWARKIFGEKNIVGFSIHEDETNPHMHFEVTPVTDDGRLSQKDWFPNPTSLKQLHEDFRQHMRQKGYDISYDKQPKRKHMSVDEYKTFKEATDKTQELQNWELDLKKRTNRLNNQKRALNAEIEAFKTQTEETTQKLQKELNEANLLLNDCKKLHQNLEFMSKSYSDSFNSTMMDRKIVELDSKLSIAYDIANQSRKGNDKQYD